MKKGREEKRREEKRREEKMGRHPEEEHKGL